MRCWIPPHCRLNWVQFLTHIFWCSLFACRHDWKCCIFLVNWLTRRCLSLSLMIKSTLCDIRIAKLAYLMMIYIFLLSLLPWICMFGLTPIDSLEVNLVYFQSELFIHNIKIYGLLSFFVTFCIKYFLIKHLKCPN